MLQVALYKTTKIPKIQDGGFVSAMLTFMLEEKTIQGAYVVNRDRNWNSGYTFATTVEEIKEAAGSKYLKSKVPWKEVEKQTGFFGFVGVPCLLEIYRKKFTRGKVPDSVTFALVCHGSFKIELLEEMKTRLQPHDITEVKKMDFVMKKNEKGKRRVVLEVKGEDFFVDLPVKKIQTFKPSSCLTCKRIATTSCDYVAGSGKQFGCAGYTVVACLTERAVKWTQQAVDANILEEKKLSEEKIENVIKRLNLSQAVLP